MVEVPIHVREGSRRQSRRESVAQSRENNMRELFGEQEPGEGLGCSMIYERELFDRMSKLDPGSREFQELVEIDRSNTDGQLTHEKYIESLQQEYEQKYVKKFPFERAVYI